MYSVAMGKNKLKRWAEIESMPRVLQPPMDFHSVDSPLKGNWNREVFGNAAPLVLELGCGRGEYTVQLAQRHPDKNFIGVDIKGARLWRGAKTMHELGLANVAFLRTRIEFIGKFFGENEVSEIWLTFPDPQPRISKQGRRLTSPFFLTQFAVMLSPGGLLHLKTDDPALFDYTKQTLEQQSGSLNCATHDLYSTVGSYPDTDIQTKYEEAFRKEGKKICYLRFQFNA